MPEATFSQFSYSIIKSQTLNDFFYTGAGCYIYCTCFTIYELHKKWKYDKNIVHGIDFWGKGNVFFFYSRAAGKSKSCRIDFILLPYLRLHRFVRCVCVFFFVCGKQTAE